MMYAPDSAGSVAVGGTGVSVGGGVFVMVAVGTGVLVGASVGDGEGVQVGTVGTAVLVGGTGVLVGGGGVGVVGFSNRFACCKHSVCENSGTLAPMTALMPRICTFAQPKHE